MSCANLRAVCEAPRWMITIDESRVAHIFRVAEGHFPEDTAESREALTDAANDSTNVLSADQFGNTGAAKTFPNGTQIWVQIRGGRITNGGINRNPRSFSPSTGLSEST